MDINKIKAGEYELVVDRWDERTSKPGEPFTWIRHRKGDVVKLSEADAKRLVLAGAVVKPGELQRRAAEAARRQYLALLRQMPDELRRELRAQDAADGLVDPDEDDAPGDGDDGDAVKPPAKTANKAVWAAYRGLTEEEAKDVTLDQLKDDAYMATFQKPAGDPSNA